MLLSVCIPTHHGRAPVLREAIDSILGQLDDAGIPVEICVSDNASRDGTADMVEGLRAGGAPIIYQRNATDLGLGRNILRSVEIATGDFCWLFGSDEVMVEGALERATRLVEAHGDVTGISANKLWFEPDMSAPLGVHPAQVLPLPRTPAVYRSAEVIFREIGVIHGYLSCNLVNRSRWDRAVAEVGPRALEHPHWPQIYVMGTMAQRDPAWAWWPGTLVKARAGTAYTIDEEEARPDPSGTWANLIGGERDVWADLHGRGSALQRSLLSATQDAVAGDDMVRQVKQQPGRTLRGDLRMLVELTRSFWWSPRFWRESLPALLAPTRARNAARAIRSRLGRQSSPLPPESCRTRVSMSMPNTLLPRSAVRVTCRIENLGPAPLRSSVPNPVTLSYRWMDAKSGEVVLVGRRTPFGRALRPGRGTDRTFALLTPWRSGEYLLCVSPVQEQVAWFDDLDAGNGWSARVEVTEPN